MYFRKEFKGHEKDQNHQDTHSASIGSEIKVSTASLTSTQEWFLNLHSQIACIPVFF